MSQKEKYLAMGGFALSAFLFFCAVINLLNGHISAVISSLGAGIFFFCISFATDQKKEKEVISV